MFRTEVCAKIADSLWGKISSAIQSIQKLNLEAASGELELVSAIVAEQIHSFRDDYPNDVFNDGFILTEFVKLLKDYVSYWKLLVSDKYSESWSTLQDVQSQLRVIYRFTEEPRLPILNHIERQCGELEKLYPYRVFFSSGIIVEEVECSICGKSIDSFECEHIAGELYRGHRAYSIVTQIKQLDHVSVTTNPADKRCTVQILDTSEQFNGVAYLANGIRNKILEPLSFSHLEFKKIRKPNNEIPVIGRNDACPCGSGKKFKKCCIAKSFIEMTHVDIIPRDFDLANILS